MADNENCKSDPNKDYSITNCNLSGGSKPVGRNGEEYTHCCQWEDNNLRVVLWYNQEFKPSEHNPGSQPMQVFVYNRLRIAELKELYLDIRLNQVQVEGTALFWLAKFDKERYLGGFELIETGSEDSVTLRKQIVPKASDSSTSAVLFWKTWVSPRSREIDTTVEWNKQFNINFTINPSYKVDYTGKLNENVVINIAPNIT